MKKAPGERWGQFISSSHGIALMIPCLIIAILISIVMGACEWLGVEEEPPAKQVAGPQIQLTLGDAPNLEQMEYPIYEIFGAESMGLFEVEQEMPSVIYFSVD